MPHHSTSVAHLTSVHPRYDTRIFLKMCRSLASYGYQVRLVVADGKGKEVRDGVHIHDVGASRGRLDRMVGATRRVLKRAIELDADVYHLHDPELLLAGLALKRRGKRVIFDAHEDLPRQILSKSYLQPALRGIISRGAGWFERFACERLDHVVGATPAISSKFVDLGITATTVANFPMVDELAAVDASAEKAHQVCYVGGITSVRGMREMVEAMSITKSGARLQLAGSFGEKGLREEVAARPGWSKVDELGFLDREGVRGVLARSVAGLVTLQPTQAYMDSLPVKMFEYMSAGLPVIASNFDLWRGIIESDGCGLCVDPLDPQAIAAAIDRLIGDQDLARRMGANGRRAVEQRYNWGIEEGRLLAIYETLLGEAQIHQGTPA